MKDYEKIKELSQVAYDFLMKTDLNALEPGRIDLKQGVFLNTIIFQTGLRESKLYEAHRNYYDIQMVVQGREIIEAAAIEKLTEEEPYDPDKDIMFFGNSYKGEQFDLKSGEFLICGPELGHMPGIVSGEDNNVKKIVFKIPVTK